MEVEWDPEKDQANQRKHGVAFLEARTVFGDPFELTIFDPDHSEGEYRFLSIGQASTGRLLVVAYSESEEGRIRIISARTAKAAEVKRYESETGL
ncbi:MAG: BrnT family toxin [Nitrococcus sp.]|nr:BrnT family toxin [Nitrococcus sp.]